MLVHNGSLVKCTKVIIGKYQSCYFSKVQCKSLDVTITNSDYVKKSSMELSNSKLATSLVKSRFIELNIHYQTTQEHKRLPPSHCLIQGGGKVTRQSRKKKNFIQTLPVRYLSITVTHVYAKVRSVTCPWMSIKQSISHLSMKKCYMSMRSYLSLIVTQIMLLNIG